MKKIFLCALTIFFINTGLSFTEEKPCSQYNKLTQNYKYTKCMRELKKSENNSKTKNFLSNLNKKYKSIREKAPKSARETWKEINK